MILDYNTYFTLTVFILWSTTLHAAPVEKRLILTSSLLEYNALYKEGELGTPVIKRVSDINTKHTILLPYYSIHLGSHMVKRLRQKLKHKLIETVSSRGYKLTITETTA